MQLLYASTRDKVITLKDLLDQYRDSIGRSFDQYLYTLYIFTRVVEQANLVHKVNKTKLRPTDKEIGFRPTLFDNPLSQSLFRNDPLKLKFHQGGFTEKVSDNSVIKSIYTEFSKEETYQDYINKLNPTEQENIDILLFLFKFCVGNETFNEIMDDYSPNWINDKSLVVGAIKKTVKSLPVFGNFFEDYYPSDETINEFGKQLLITFWQNKANNVEEIKPALENWDINRVAIIDLILIQMALCEFTQFPTIPTKVTLNEYVDIAKMYSTDKSKEFVNGLLDRLMKKLIKEDKIVKEGRGLV